VLQSLAGNDKDQRVVAGVRKSVGRAIAAESHEIARCNFINLVVDDCFADP
jgi:hypothetical protein